MKLKVIRQIFTGKSTVGELLIDGQHFCWTIEDIDRDKNKDGDLTDTGETKVYGETAIPSGKYKVTLSMSNRFKRILPEIHNVVGFSGVRVHRGNTAVDSHGCIIVGYIKAADFVGDSKNAEEALVKKLTGINDIELEITYEKTA